MPKLEKALGFGGSLPKGYFSLKISMASFVETEVLAPPFEAADPKKAVTPEFEKRTATIAQAKKYLFIVICCYFTLRDGD
jgi:hypothetical protein